MVETFLPQSVICAKCILICLRFLVIVRVRPAMNIVDSAGAVWLASSSTQKLLQKASRQACKR